MKKIIALVTIFMQLRLYGKSAKAVLYIPLGCDFVCSVTTHYDGTTA